MGLVLCALRRWGGGIDVGSRAAGGNGSAPIVGATELWELREHFYALNEKEEEEMQKQVSARLSASRMSRMRRRDAVGRSLQKARQNAAAESLPGGEKAGRAGRKGVGGEGPSRSRLSVSLSGDELLDGGDGGGGRDVVANGGDASTVVGGGECSDGGSRGVVGTVGTSKGDRGGGGEVPPHMINLVERAVSDAADAVEADARLDYHTAVRRYEASAAAIDVAIDALPSTAGGRAEKAVGEVGVGGAQDRGADDKEEEEEEKEEV